MINYLILLLLLSAIFHFIIENIAIPEYRVLLRYRLYALRDQLRELEMTNPEGVSQEAFAVLNESINSWVHDISQISLTDYVEIKRALEVDEELQQAVKERMSVVHNVENKEFEQIHLDVMRNITKAIGFNSMGWGVYFLPVIIVLVLIGLIVDITRGLRLRLVKLSERIVFTNIIKSKDSLPVSFS